MENDRITLSFEPWFVKSSDRIGVPCLRITFHRDWTRIVLTELVVDPGPDFRTVDLEAARGALQARKECTSD